MNCTACGQTLEFGETKCPFCGTEAPRRNELALDLTPPPPPPPPPPSASRQPTPSTPREPLGRDQADKPWREEVRDRVHERRRDRGFESDLPLFAARPQAPRPSVTPPPRPRPPVTLGAEPADDLPLRAPVPAQTPQELLDDEGEVPDADASPGLSPGSWLLGDTPSGRELPAVERPAAGLERAQAAALDIALLFLVWGVILYFSGKATRVGLTGLRPSWPVVIGYLVFVGLAYATYFTGVAGRTPGKMVLGLRVVDTQGRAPGLLRALFRALFGVALTAAAGIGLLPMMFDPARRALHDRLFGTRVIRV
jgi:uncharacterized RDD family membrane protein YckC